MIEAEALEEAIEMSGGVVREFIRILKEAIFFSKGMIKKDHIDSSIVKIRNAYNLFSTQINTLKNIQQDPEWIYHAKENAIEVENVLIELLHMPAVFQYRNGEDKWYRPYLIFIDFLNRLAP